MRGTPVGFVVERRIVRFIPAYAGNTGYDFADDAAAPVHPRVCGEHISFIVRNLSSGGSSPRMRGTLAIADAVEAGTRFIPAYAGNTRLA